LAQNAEVQPGTLEQAAKDANKGKFVAAPGQLPAKARLAVQAAEPQAKVWGEVKKVRGKAGARLMMKSANLNAVFAEKQVVVKYEPYVKNLKEQVAGQKNIVGVAVAVNGKVQTVDIFESTPLFTKLWPKMLKSAALDASMSAGEKDAEKPCPLAVCVDFLEDAKKNKVQSKKTEKGMLHVRSEGRRNVRFMILSDGDENAAATPGKPAEPVHETIFAK
jgi:hypothetical protein